MHNQQQTGGKKILDEVRDVMRLLREPHGITERVVKCLVVDGNI